MTHVTNDGTYPNQATRKQTQWTAGLSLTQVVQVGNSINAVCRQRQFPLKARIINASI